jgi:SdpC family antimicrobial peptide
MVMAIWWFLAMRAPSPSRIVPPSSVEIADREGVMSKFPRSAVLVAGLAFVMSGWLSPSSAAAASAAGGPQQAPISKHYDGEALFRGLAFAQGPVAALFPRLRAVPAPTAAAEPVLDRLVSRMAQQEPGFFARFQRDVQSGNRLRVRAAFLDARQALSRAIRTEFGNAKQRKATADCVFIDLALVLIAAGVVVLLIEVAVVTVEVVMVTALIDINIEAAIGDSASTGAAIEFDRWTQDAADTLADRGGALDQ